MLGCLWIQRIRKHYWIKAHKNFTGKVTEGTAGQKNRKSARTSLSFENVFIEMRVRLWEQSGVLRERRGTAETRVSGSLPHSCHSLLEKAGGFIKPLNPAESVKSSRQQPLPPWRRPEVRVERLRPELRFL